MSNIRRKTFIPNLQRGRSQPRNLPIFLLPRPRRTNRNVPRRNRNRISRNRRFRSSRANVVMFGQQQDLAFQPKTSVKGMGNTFTTPVSESKTIQTFFKFSNNSITLCQPVAAICYVTNTAVVTLHPMMVNARCANIARAFSCYQITHAILHYVPLIGSTSTGMVAIGSTQRCVPLTRDTTTQFASLTSINAEINPVWMCSKYQVKDLDNSLKNLEPNNKSDMPNNVYVVGSGLAGNLNVSCTLFLEITFTLAKPTPDVYLTLTPATPTLVISAAGIRTTTPGATFFGIVLTSTASNIDVGELVKIPAMSAAATDYDINIDHNGQLTNYNQVDDQGTLVVQVVWVQ